MTPNSDAPKMPRGGAFVLEPTPAECVLIPENLSAEARLIAKTAEEFMRRDVLPVADRIEANDYALMESLVRKAGTLGLLAGHVPERYGGLGLPISTLTLMAEMLATNPAFAVSVATLPLVYFGTEAQKQKYLPKLASGELIGAFALSEANAGSDALSAQTKAILDADGTHYLLNGTKMWITNGGFADLFTIFAKVDGTEFTAFLVERNTPGLILDREEHKMGLHGSSTRRLTLENARVPIDNVLGEIGKGHRPALCALNLGRLHIGTTALGMAKTAMNLAVRYAKDRQQFGKPIAEFPLIQQKIAMMAVDVALMESMIYRTAGYLDAAFAAIETETPDTLRAASEEYAIECAIVKFHCTEKASEIIDEALQIHGGYGYSEEFPIAQLYRDIRVFRIFEGTNEINRLTAADQLVRRVHNGQITMPDNIRHGIVLPLLKRYSDLSQEERFNTQETAADLAYHAAQRYAGQSLSLRFEILSLAPDSLLELIMGVFSGERVAAGREIAAKILTTH